MRKPFITSMLLATLLTSSAPVFGDDEGSTDQNDYNGYEQSRSFGVSSTGLGLAALGLGGILLIASESTSNNAGHSH
jgi:hypothetical protein